jgi:Rrf2 family protein
MELALREGQGPVQLREVARAQSISPKYLEQLAIALHHAGLVITERGPSGGYRLARPAGDITALDVVQAVEGPLSLIDCLGRSNACERSRACATRELWARVEQAIQEELAGTTLAELGESQQMAEARLAVCYQI